MENLKLLFQLYIRPISAISDLMDKGSWFWSAVFVFVISTAFYLTVNQKLHNAYSIPTYDTYYSEQTRNLEMSDEQYDQLEQDFQKAVRERPKVPIIGDRIFYLFSFEPNGFFRPLISLAVFYIPLSILLISLFGHIGKFGVIFQRDYGTLSTCSMTAWSAAHLPFAAIGIVLFGQTINPQIYLAFWLVSGLFFGLLMIFTLRVVFGVNYGIAILVVAISWLGFSLGMYVFKFISPMLFSPFILFYAYLYFGGTLTGEARGFGNVFRQRQNFKRHLQNATINPRDADAHIQLGLIYNQRRQTDKAFEHFNKAFEIDKKEPDANYELGKIYREKGELSKAIEHFSVVVEENDKHALSEIWREIGATYLAANMLTEAKNALETFIQRRPYDAEGLYYLGKALKQQGESEKARDFFQQAIESAKNSPDHRKHEAKNWSRLAQKEL